MSLCRQRQLYGQILRTRDVNYKATGGVPAISGHSLLRRRQASTETGFFGDSTRLVKPHPKHVLVVVGNQLDLLETHNRCVQCFESIHNAVGLPWWATLPMCAVAMRVSLVSPSSLFSLLSCSTPISVDGACNFDRTTFYAWLYLQGIPYTRLSVV
jgi:hypothetical protein